MFVDFYKENRGNADVLAYAKQVLIGDTLSKPLLGLAKLQDLESSDMESKISEPFMPSLFYTFKYVAETDVIAGMPAVDYIPIMLCFKKSGKYVEGVNFNLLPNDMRAVILDAIDKSFDNYYTDKGLNEAQKGELAINETFGSILVSDSGKMQFLKYFETKCGVPISKAYRRYNLSHISSMRMIEYGNYKYIPLLYFDDAVRGASLSKLQDAVISPDK